MDLKQLLETSGKPNQVADKLLEVERLPLLEQPQALLRILFETLPTSQRESVCGQLGGWVSQEPLNHPERCMVERAAARGESVWFERRLDIGGVGESSSLEEALSGLFDSLAEDYGVALVIKTVAAVKLASFSARAGVAI